MTQVETLELLVNSQLEQIRSQQQTNQVLAESNQKLALQTEELQKKVNELLSQVAWLNRQLLGRRSEKLAVLDPNQLSLFDTTLPAEEQARLDIARDTAVAAIRQHESETKTERRNRKLLEGLPVVEVFVEPTGIDLNLYKRIGEERTRTLEFEPGKCMSRK